MCNFMVFCNFKVVRMIKANNKYRRQSSVSPPLCIQMAPKDESRIQVGEAKLSFAFPGLVPLGKQSFGPSTLAADSFTVPLSNNDP